MTIDNDYNMLLMQSYTMQSMIRSLLKYAGHLGDCDLFHPEGGEICTCGLDRLETAAEKVMANYERLIEHE